MIAIKLKNLLKIKKTVVVQGLGFVYSAMVVALTQAIKNGEILYNVIGVDIGDKKNYWKIAKSNQGKPPFKSADKNMGKAYLNAKKINNFLATYINFYISKADIVIIDLQLDVKKVYLVMLIIIVFHLRNLKKQLKKLLTMLTKIQRL